MKRAQWVERSFNFDFPEGVLPNVIERLAGTELRMTAMTSGLSETHLCEKTGGNWSIKEQIGHLVDLEDLHIGRLKEMKKHKPILPPRRYV